MTVTLTRSMVWRWLAPLTLAAAAACGGRGSAAQPAQQTTGGDPQKGVEAIAKYGCGACHTIPGIKDASATIGPPLEHIASRQILGGHLQNTPENMARWIQDPQKIDPRNAMPKLGVTDDDARNIVAYLYTLK
jgi:cytochrome c1